MRIDACCLPANFERLPDGVRLGGRVDLEMDVERSTGQPTAALLADELTGRVDVEEMGGSVE